MKKLRFLLVDDTVLFCDAVLDQLRAIRCLRLCFEAVSGLKVNLGKSELVPLGDKGAFWLIAVLGCKLVLLPITYIELQLESSFTGCAVSRGVWKIWKKCMSKGGRLTLIKSTLLSFPVSLFSLFTMPI